MTVTALLGENVENDSVTLLYAGEPVDGVIVKNGNQVADKFSE